MTLSLRAASERSPPLRHSPAQVQPPPSFPPSLLNLSSGLKDCKLPGMISTGQIDQTHRALAATQPSLLTLPFRFLPTWALVALVLVAAYCSNQLLAAYKLRAKAERYRIERRRKAGIPDSDKREFRLAAADVLRSRKIEDERRERERTLRKRASRPNGDWERFGTINGLRERPNQGCAFITPMRCVVNSISLRFVSSATPRRAPRLMLPEGPRIDFDPVSQPNVTTRSSPVSTIHRFPRRSAKLRLSRTMNYKRCPSASMATQTTSDASSSSGRSSPGAHAVKDTASEFSTSA